MVSTSFPYLPDVFTFPRRERMGVYYSQGREETGKIIILVHTEKLRMTSIARKWNWSSAKYLKCFSEERDSHLPCTSQLRTGYVLGNFMLHQYLRAVVWSHLTPEGEEGVIEEEAETRPLPSHSALRLHSSFSEPPSLPSHPVRQRH